MFHRLAVLLVPVAALTVLADEPKQQPFDWPQWQGQNRTGVSKEKGLLQDWPKDDPPLLWRVEGLGEGYSTPTVSAGRIFTMGNIDGTEYVIVRNEADGKPLWKEAVGPERANGGGYPGPRSSPTVDGDRVYALGLNGDLLCVEFATGKLVWRKNLPKDFAGSVGPWGFSESPLIDGDRVLCTPGGRDATLVAVDNKTGDLVWKGSVPDGDQANYSSIIAIDFAGKRQYVQFLSGGVVGLSAEGKFLWRYDRPANGTANCSTPIYRDGLVFAASNYGTGGGQVKLTADGAKVSATQTWFSTRIRNHHGGVVLVGDHLYGSDEGQLVCLEWKTGKVMWSERSTGKGSVAVADGRLYYRNEDGAIILAEINPEKYVEHGRFEQPKRSDAPAWPHPVIANGRLYIRDQDSLLCYDVKRR
jgi:outer membrane protein assembly factor BamB